MPKKCIPQRVVLRKEQRWPEDMPWHERYLANCSEYCYRPDPELDAIIAAAGNDAAKAFELWYAKAKPNMRNQRGVHLIAEPLQKIAGLPLRQVYVDKESDEIYRVDPEPNGIHGQTTLRLFPQ